MVEVLLGEVLTLSSLQMSARFRGNLNGRPTIAPAHKEIADVHHERVLQRNGLYELARCIRVLNLQPTAVVLKEHSDGTPISMCWHTRTGLSLKLYRRDRWVV